MVFTDRKNLTVIELDEERDVFSYDELIPLLLERPSDVIYVEVQGKVYGIITAGNICQMYREGIRQVTVKTNFIAARLGDYAYVQQVFNGKRNISFVPVIDSEKRLLGEYTKQTDLIALQHMDFFGNLPYIAEVLRSFHAILVKPYIGFKKKQQFFWEFKRLLEEKGATLEIVDYQEAIAYAYEPCNILCVDEQERMGLFTLCHWMLCDTRPIKANFITYQEFLFHSSDDIKTLLSSFQERNVSVLLYDFQENEHGYLESLKEGIQKKFQQYGLDVFPYLFPELRKEFLGELYEKYEGKEFPVPISGFHMQNGVWILRDMDNEFFHIKQGVRYTVGQPQDNVPHIYMCGPCVMMGNYVEDQYTIPSLLQEKLNHAGLPFKVINLGVPGGNKYMLRGHIERLFSEEIAEGDIIVFYSCKIAFDNIPMLNLVDVLEEKNIPVSWLIDKPEHCNHKTNQVFMEAIYEKLLPALHRPARVRKVLEKDSDLVKRFYIDKYFADFNHLAYKSVGSIVMNCNPFTLGHRYLIETALKQVEFLIIFVVEEDLSLFPFAERFAMVRAGTADLKNVMVVPSGEFILSKRSFPEYFKKETDADIIENTENDVTLFAEKIAPKLGITHRFVGEELEDEVTNAYNQAMKHILPGYGIQLVEIPRKRNGKVSISASRVRKCIETNSLDELQELIPDTTKQILFYKNS